MILIFNDWIGCPVTHWPDTVLLHVYCINDQCCGGRLWDDLNLNRFECGTLIGFRRCFSSLLISMEILNACVMKVDRFHEGECVWANISRSTPASGPINPQNQVCSGPVASLSRGSEHLSRLFSLQPRLPRLLDMVLSVVSTPFGPDVIFFKSAALHPQTRRELLSLSLIVLYCFKSF